MNADMEKPGGGRTEPGTVSCGWCGTANRRDESGLCAKCGGPLPLMPGEGPGPEPPPAPRLIPEDYVKRVRYTRNPWTIAGIAITVILIWSIVFPLLGIGLWIYGLKRAKRRLQPLIQGTSVKGRILNVLPDTSRARGGRHPWKLAVEYETPKGPYVAEIAVWDAVHAKRPPGEPVWVLYDAESPDLCSVWPPVA